MELPIAQILILAENYEVIRPPVAHFDLEVTTLSAGEAADAIVQELRKRNGTSR